MVSLFPREKKRKTREKKRKEEKKKEDRSQCPWSCFVITIVTRYCVAVNTMFFNNYAL